MSSVSTEEGDGGGGVHIEDKGMGNGSGSGSGKRPTGQDLYFQNPFWELWFGGGELVGGLSSFVLTWTLFYGLVR